MSASPKDGQLGRLSRAARAAGRRQSLNAALRRLTVLLPVPLVYVVLGLAFAKWSRPSAEVATALKYGFYAACLFVVIAVAVVGWARRPRYAGALALDRHHRSADRVANALAFSEIPKERRSPFMDAAIADALAAVERPSPGQAVPLQLPRLAWASVALLLLAVSIARLENRPRAVVAPVPAALPVAHPVALSDDDLGLLREAALEFRELGDNPELNAAVADFNRVVEDIAGQRVDREEVFRRLAAVERSLGVGADADALDAGLEELAARLGESPLARKTADALEQKRLPDAERALRELAERLTAKDKPNTAEIERLRQALAAAAQESSGRVERLEAARREAEQQERRLLQKKGAEPPSAAPDQQANVERQRRRLERLDRDLSKARQSQQALSQLDKELAKAAQELMRDMAKSGQHLQAGAEQVNRMGQKQATEREKRELLRQLEELRELLRQGGAGKQQHQDRLKQFAQRARGGRQGSGKQPAGEGKTPGGQRGAPQLTLGSGADPAMTPMPGAGSSPGGTQPGSNDPSGGGKDSGSGSNPGAGTAKDLEGKTLDVSAAALDTGQGQASSEVVFGAAERGFTGSRYQKVFTQYRTVAEDVLERDTIPAGYEFYVRRYFQLIRPREAP